MNVGTLVNVSEGQIYTEGLCKGPGSYDEKLGYIIETLSREEVVKMILRRKIGDVIEKLTEGKMWVKSDELPEALDIITSTWVYEDLPNDWHENYEDLPNFHKVMLENGIYGWVEEYWLEEV